MAKRKVRRRVWARWGEDPTAVVRCEIHKGIPKPHAHVHRAAGKGRLTPGHHWLLEAVCARDADKSECAIQGIECREQGYAHAQRWVDNSRARIVTESGQALAGRPAARIAGPAARDVR
ncbi:hypothetical protein [Streptomyces hayashii]|uniref:hypothetical protein n=1 Tax=Streptomyces hayashii TaxID=2839966 RepID=UPI00403CEF0F